MVDEAHLRETYANRLQKFTLSRSTKVYDAYMQVFSLGGGSRLRTKRDGIVMLRQQLTVL